MRTAVNRFLVIAQILRGAVNTGETEAILAAAAELEALAHVPVSDTSDIQGEGPSERLAVGQRVRICGNTGIPNAEGRFGVVTQRHPDGVAVRVKLLDGRVILVEPSNCDTTERDAEDAARYRALVRGMERHGGASWAWLAGEGIVYMSSARDLDAFTGVLIDEQRECAGKEGSEATT